MSLRQLLVGQEGVVEEMVGAGQAGCGCGLKSAKSYPSLRGKSPSWSLSAACWARSEEPREVANAPRRGSRVLNSNAFPAAKR